MAVPFAYYERLSPARRRVYRRSDAIGTLDLPEGLQLGEIVAAIAAELSREERVARQGAVTLPGVLGQRSPHRAHRLQSRTHMP
ncbi:MAG: hypothetical protein M3Z31_10770 [Pseudomonadota bacterium]|nr:hypothetical protein [Pseudomonadota bacterium]